MFLFKLYYWVSSFFFFLMIRRPPRSTLDRSSAASDVYKRQVKAWITNIAHDTNTATAVGFYTSCESVCALLASTMAGFVWNISGSTVTFLVTAISALGISFYFQIRGFQQHKHTVK